jgi:hypothetical protein
MERWSRVIMMLAWFLLAGCSEGAKLVQETESGGVVTYPFKGENGYMFAKFRAEAIQLIEQRCAGRYTIVKEAEAKGRNRVMEIAGQQEQVTERRWGMQFRCK